LPSTGWAGYEAQQLEIFNHIADKGIEGVFFVSGGLQFGGLGHCNTGILPGNNLWEIMVGPTGTAISPLKDYLSILGLAGGNQYKFFVDTWSYTRFEIDPYNVNIKVDFINDVGLPINSATLNYTLTTTHNPCLQP